MVSFDIASLFTNIPLLVTIDIYTDVLDCGHLCNPEDIFKELMLIASEGVEFSYSF